MEKTDRYIPEGEVGAGLLREHRDLILLCVNPLVFGKTYMPSYFSLPYAEFHEEIHNLADLHQFLAIAAPRRHAKSTHFSFLRIIHNICYRKSKFVLLVSDTRDQSFLFLESIRMEFETNDKLQRHYNVQVIASSGRRLVLKVCGEEVCILALGVGAKFRGLKFRERRPDLVILDDAENDEQVMNDQRRQRLVRWFFKVLYPAISSSDGDNPAQIIAIGTILHSDSLLMNLIKDPKFHSVIYQIMIDESTPLWPEQWSLEKILQEMEEFRKRGLLDVFFQEYFNAPIDPLNKRFEISRVIYYSEEDLFGSKKMEKWDRIITVDLAAGGEGNKKETNKNDFNSLLVSAYDPLNDRIYVLEYARFQEDDIDVIQDKFFEMANHWRCQFAGVETNQAQNYFYKAIQKEARKRGCPINIVPLMHSQKFSKYIRILMLQPWVKRSAVYMSRRHQELLNEMSDFPRGEHDDVLDSLAMALEVIEPQVFSREGTNRRDWNERAKNLSALQMFDRDIDTLYKSGHESYSNQRRTGSVTGY